MAGVAEAQCESQIDRKWLKGWKWALGLGRTGKLSKGLGGVFWLQVQSPLLDAPESPISPPAPPELPSLSRVGRKISTGGADFRGVDCCSCLGSYGSFAFL